MNQTLWNAIEKFELEQSLEAYGFETRLATENGWTLDYTRRAILEYRKFMYMAATAGQMVSPSEPIDRVWHLHLIFTDSYTKFCQILGKRIEHIPSTHNPTEHEKFKAAREFTKTSYTNNFGEQPTDIWDNYDMLDDLPLAPGRNNMGKLTLWLGLAFLILAVPVFTVLQPVFIQTDNPFFLQGYWLFFALLIVILHLFIATTTNGIMRKIKNMPVIKSLEPAELHYLKNGNRLRLIHGFINKMIGEKRISIDKDGRLNLLEENYSTNAAENQIIRTLQGLHNNAEYKLFIGQIAKNEAFKQYEKSAEMIKTKVRESKPMLNAYAIATTIMFAYLSIGVGRLVLGMMREKPVGFLLLSMIAMGLITAWFLGKIANYFFTNTLPAYYKLNFLSREQVRQPEWNYVFAGNVALAASFIPLVTMVDSHSGNVSGGCSSGCGSSCGGGCGGGCGGCGG